MPGSLHDPVACTGRVVRTDVLFPLAQKLLKGTIRDEDVVTIRVAVDVNSLHIHNNHPPDASVVSEASALAGVIQKTNQIRLCIVL